MEEFKDTPERGDLAVPCLASKCKFLLLSQLSRLLKSEDTKSMDGGFSCRFFARINGGYMDTNIAPLKTLTLNTLSLAV